MEVIQEGRLIYWNFVKWQFWGCKFRRQFCQLCVTSQKNAETLTLTQSCEFLCRNALFCKVQSLFLRVNCNYMWWKEASQAWLLLTIILYFCGTKKKTTTTKTKKKTYQQGPITPDNLLYTLLFLPKNAFMAVAANWENTFLILYIQACDQTIFKDQTRCNLNTLPLL